MRPTFKFRETRVLGVPRWPRVLALSLLWCGSLLRPGFDPWPRNFGKLWVWQKKKKKLLGMLILFLHPFQKVVMFSVFLHLVLKTTYNMM